MAASTANKTGLSVEEATRLFASDDLESKQRLEKWIQSGPASAVNETIVAVAGKRLPGFPVHLTFALAILLIVAVTIVLPLYLDHRMTQEMAAMRQRAGLPPSTMPHTSFVPGIAFLPVYFMPLITIWRQFSQGGKAGRRAAERLMQTQDFRAIRALALLWRPFAPPASEAERVQSWLEAVLPRQIGPISTEENKALLYLVRTAYPRVGRQRGDFSDASANVIVEAIRLLAESRLPEHIAALRRVAAHPVPPNAPNRALLRDMATLFLDDPKPVVPVKRPDVVAPLAGAPPTVTLRRRG